MFRNHHSISVALLGSFLVGCAGEPSATPGTGSVHTATVTSTGPIPPYTAQATELDEAGGQVLAKALRAIDGVEDVDLDLEALQVSVQTKSGQFLYEPQVQGAFASAGVELASFSPPSEALVTVYVVEAAGGG